MASVKTDRSNPYSLLSHDLKFKSDTAMSTVVPVPQLSEARKGGRETMQYIQSLIITIAIAGTEIFGAILNEYLSTSIRNVQSISYDAHERLIRQLSSIQKGKGLCISHF